MVVRSALDIYLSKYSKKRKTKNQCINSDWWNPQIQDIMKQSTSRMVLQGINLVAEYMDMYLLGSKLRRTAPRRKCTLTMFTPSSAMGLRVMREAMESLVKDSRLHLNKTERNPSENHHYYRQQGIIQKTVMAQLDNEEQAVVVVRTESLLPSEISREVEDETNSSECTASESGELAAIIESSLSILCGNTDVKVHNHFTNQFVYLYGVDPKVLVDTTADARKNP